ncbi:uncharacterized protein LOC119635814 [Glossina fuscipes]|uniref:Uncharacterized protein LOC119635814 n=1 Tax=Glossina fuscipes TaxID=7396 RepID=A0A9C5YYW9_9MUSC|nr:uncharacterized protein LOC119635814 [Glossina fuscipes]KAI9583572.1 hypothetical protein GQX74_005320 [Glossina fuscipes]
MKFLSTITVVIAVLLFVQRQSAERYRFVHDEPEIYRDCRHAPEMLGFKQMADMSDLEIIFNDEGLYVNGTATVVWDVKQTDRITVHAELEKFSRSSWQPTPFGMFVEDFCKEMTDPNSKIHNVWVRHIFPEDRQCFEKGTRYRHEPFAGVVEVEVKNYAFKGRYRAVENLRVYDENGNLKPGKSACLEVPGDFMKVK